jgi:hypothetical protein
VLFCGVPLPILCCSTAPITLFTLSYLPLTVWNSRLCVAKFLSGQYTLYVPAANCLHLSPALPMATVCIGVYPQVDFRRVSLGRVPPPDGSETSSSLRADTDLFCVCYVVCILHQNILTRWPSDRLVLFRLFDLSVLTFASCFPAERVGRGMPSSNRDWNFRCFCVIAAPILFLQNDHIWTCFCSMYFPQSHSFIPSVKSILSS